MARTKSSTYPSTLYPCYDREVYGHSSLTWTLPWTDPYKECGRTHPVVVNYFEQYSCSTYDGYSYCCCTSPPGSGPATCTGVRRSETWFEPWSDPCNICGAEACSCTDWEMLLSDRCSDPAYHSSNLGPGLSCNNYEKPSNVDCFEETQCLQSTSGHSCGIGGETYTTYGDLGRELMNNNIGQQYGYLDNPRLWIPASTTTKPRTASPQKAYVN